MLAGCGGGGSGGGTVVTPTPTPTSPTYLSARDFSQYRSVSDFGTRIDSFRPTLPPAQPWRTLALGTTTALGGIGFTYYPSPKSYQAVYLNEFQEFRQIEAMPATWVGDQDYRPGDPSPLRRYFRYVQADTTNSTYDLNYVGIVSWSDYTVGAMVGAERGDREVWRYHLYGAVTVASDLPKTGRTTYRSGFSPGGGGRIDLTVDWASGEVTGAKRVNCIPSDNCTGADLGELRFTGQFDGTRRVLGTISGSAGYQGTFVGGFYGPRAAEIGIVGDVRHPTRGDSIFPITAKGS
jgi:hypothetical protein